MTKYEFNSVADPAEDGLALSSTFPSIGSGTVAYQAPATAAAHGNQLKDPKRKPQPLTAQEEETSMTKSYCNQHFAEDRACTRCGLKGHYTLEDSLNYSSCEYIHPVGCCPLQKVTCFLCEGEDHVSIKCPLYAQVMSRKTSREDRGTLAKVRGSTGQKAKSEPSRVVEYQKVEEDFNLFPHIT